MVNYCKFPEPEPVALGDGRFVNTYGYGQVDITMILGNKEKDQSKSILTKVFYVPKLATNLFSARAATSKGKVVQFGHTLGWIKDSKGQVVARGRLVGNMYRLDCKVDKPENQASIANETATKLDQWHQRMAHLNVGQIQTMASKELITGSDIPGTSKLRFCDACAEGKAHRALFKPVGEIQSTRRLELHHSVVVGPMKTESFGGANTLSPLSMITPDVSLSTQ